MGNLLEAKVIVKIDGESNEFIIDANLELKKLKKKIEEKTNIPVNDQELFKFGSEPLPDFISLKSLGINSKSDLYLYKKNELFEIKVSSRDYDYDDKDNNFTIKIHKNMEISFIKQIIAGKADLKSGKYIDNSFVFKSTVLQDSRLVKDYKIKKGSKIVVTTSHKVG